MKKTKEFIVRILKSPVLINIAGIVSLALLMMLVVLISLISITNFWNKVLATCYVVATIGFMVISGTPKTGKSVGFNKIGFVSFLMWCAIIPIIIGILLMALIMKLASGLPIDDLGFWSMAICITLFSFVWFLTKLYGKSDATSYLDLYSTAWIAIVTILTTLFDLQDKKGAFVFLLAMYFILQLLIKGQICRRLETEKDK